MPFIKISTLKNVPERERIMKNIEKALYDIKVKGAQLIPDNMATCMWQSLDIVVHKIDAHRMFNKKDKEIPIFVDLYMNSVFNQDGISFVMETIADGLSSTGEINRKNVVIMVHVGKPGYIFINGAIDDCRIYSSPDQ